MFSNIAALGMEPAFAMTSAPPDKTFYYRHENKRIIESIVLSDARLNRVVGPLLYAVQDHNKVLRYIGKSVADKPLHSRWFRHGYIHHQTSSRQHFLEELDAERGPLVVWSVTAQELRSKLPPTHLTDYALAEAIEGLWIARWKSQLWNKKTPSFPVGFTDGEFWQS